MKLYRFTAPNAQTAIFNVHESLGPDALVYSTRKILDGVEVLAGPGYGRDGVEHTTEPDNAEAVSIEKSVPAEVRAQAAPSLDQKAIESLKLQILSMSEHLQKLSSNINSLQQYVTENLIKKKPRWSLFKTIGIRKNLKEGIYGRQSTH